MFGRGAIAQMEFGAAAPDALPAIIPQDYQPPLSQPTFRLPPYRTANQQFATFVQAEPFGEGIATIDRWDAFLSEPVRFRTALPNKVALATALQQFAAFVQFAPFAESVTADRWAQELSEPVRFRRSLPTRAQQFAAFVKASPFLESVTADRWIQPLSQPSWRPKRLPIAAYPFAALRSEWPVILHERMATLTGTATLHGVSTSHYKTILNNSGARLIFTAIVTPWSPADRR